MTSFVNNWSWAPTQVEDSARLLGLESLDGNDLEVFLKKSLKGSRTSSVKVGCEVDTQKAQILYSSKACMTHKTTACKLLVRDTPELCKTMPSYSIAVGCPPKLYSKILLLKTQSILTSGY